MITLKEALPPPNLIWIVSHEDEYATPDTIETLKSVIATSVYTDRKYLYDVLSTLSRFILLVYGQPGNTFLPSVSDRTKVPCMNTSLSDLKILARAYIYHGNAKRRMCQRLVYACGAKLWQDLHFKDDVFVTNDGVESRYNRIFGPSGVVAECVFKGSGDFIVHTMLQIKNVASHCACDIIKGDNIFGVAAAAYGAKANGVVRQYLDRPPVDFVKEGRQTDETLRFITTACVLMEICNDKKTTLLKDRDIIKKGDDLPQLFVTADGPPYDGTERFGITDGKECICYKTTQEAILAYAEKAKAHTIESMEQVCLALFDPEKLPAQSTLQTYVSGSA